MNWNSHEFIWLDWTILAVGIVAVIWAVWRSVQKTNARNKEQAVKIIYLVKVSHGTSLVLLSLQPISVRNIW